MPDLIGTSGRVDIEKVDKNKWVDPENAHGKGYWGYSPEEDRDQYTVAGVTGGTANASGAPDPAAEKRVRDSAAPLRGSKS
ncbi:MAG: hypothetical protein ACREX8_00065 [Gammaproteobacteria bacterium]